MKTFRKNFLLIITELLVHAHLVCVSVLSTGSFSTKEKSSLTGNTAWGSTRSIRGTLKSSGRVRRCHRIGRGKRLVPRGIGSGIGVTHGGRVARMWFGGRRV